MNGRGGRYLLNSLRQLEARDWLILGCVAAVALFLRWQRLDNPEFAYDQAWSLNRTWEFVHEGRFPFHGEISSHGVPHGPTEIFMLAPVVVISSAPEAATAYVGMLQVLAVILTYLIAVRHLGSTTALVASSLYAINPWTIYFARKLWPPSIMALPSALLLLSILEFVRSRRQRWLVAAGFFAGALAMAHPSGFLVLIAVCLITAQQWRHISISGVLLATMATLVPALPYLLYDAQQGFAFVRGYASVPAATAATLDLQGLELLLNMTSGADQLMKLQDAWLGGANLLAPLFFALITALMIAGSILWLPPLCRRIQSLANSADTQRVCLALFLWLVVPVLLTLRHGIELNQPYYVAL